MTDFKDRPYRPCVGIALFNAQGDIFVGERIDTPGAWQMPQGGIDEGEDLEAAAMRELGEEIGTDKAEIIKIADGTTWWKRMEPSPTTSMDGCHGSALTNLLACLTTPTAPP